jgi:3D (Asp-Asp-Asp) domain-containing protein
MKKLVAIVTVAIMINFVSPLVPQVHAAALDSKVTEAIAQNSSSARIQELLKLKENLEQGKTDEVLNALAKAALEQAGTGNAATSLTDGNISNISNAMKNALRQEIQQGVSQQLAPYQKGLDAIATLFNGNQALKPETTINNNSLQGAPQNYQRMLNMKATAYSPGTLDNGKWNDKTYMGGKVRKGVAAVDPRVIPMGTRLWVEGYGEAIAEDQGSAIKGNRIDLAFDNRQAALDYGIQNRKVYVLN